MFYESITSKHEKKMFFAKNIALLERHVNYNDLKKTRFSINNKKKRTFQRRETHRKNTRGESLIIFITNKKTQIKKKRD